MLWLMEMKKIENIGAVNISAWKMMNSYARDNSTEKNTYKVRR